MPDKDKDKKPQVPLQPKDFFRQFDAVPDTFGGISTRETVRQLGSFNPREYPYVDSPTPYDDARQLTNLNNQRQPYMKQAENGLQQFGANFLSGFGQGIANITDIASWGNENYQSSLFGISTKNMQDWAIGVGQRNKILRENPSSFDPSSFGWYMEQFASAGTGVGMAAEALLETVGVEALTGGMGTGAAVNKLKAALSNIFKTGGKTALTQSFSAIKDLRSAATVFGVLNRTNESRMEAMQSYDEIYNELTSTKNPDGTAKFTKEQAQQLAAEGADRTFMGNLALLPLDILAYRTMVFNPISGAGEGLLERGLSKIGNKLARKATQGLVFSSLEGTEEGFQYVVQNEGKHYANVLGGMDDGSSFLGRLGNYVRQDEFWNNFAGGVIGSPIIGGAMHLANKVMTGNRAAKMSEVHNDYIENIAKMDSGIANQIATLQEQGKTKEADILRRQFRANKALSALHLDAMTDNHTAFDSHLNFLQSTLDEVNAGNLSSLQDLGFSNPTVEQADYIKENFQKSIDDAKELKLIYDNVKDKYNKNFIPQVTLNHFHLNRLLEAQGETTSRVTQLQAGLFQYNQLSNTGRELYNSEYELEGLQAEQKRLTDLFRTTTNGEEKANVNQALEINKAKMIDVKSRIDEIGKDDTYTESQKNLDNDILNSALKDRNYSQAMYDKIRLDNEIALQRKNISLWNNPAYLKSKTQESVAKARTRVQNDNNIQANPDAADIAKATEEKNNQIAADGAAQELRTQQATTTFGNQSLFEEDNSIIDNIASAVPSTQPDTAPQNDAGTPEFLFSPAEYDFENSDQASKDKIIGGVAGLLNKLGNGATFEDLVRHIVKVQGVDVADNIFNALKYGWEKNGKPAQDYAAIYRNIFENPVGQLMEGVQGLVQTPAQLKEATDVVTNKIVAQQQEKKEFDNNNQPLYIYEGIVTNEASPKMAFSTRLSNLIQNIGENGEVIVSHEYTEEELNTGDYVESLQLLDPDSFIEGEELQIKIPANYLDIKIPVYNADGTKGHSITFGTYVAQNKLSPEMQEYQDKVPMIIYKKNAKPQDKGVAFIHDIGWYHPLRFNQRFENDMKEAIANTRSIREEVLGNSDNSVPIVITGKRQTTFAGLKTKEGETISLKEANPETELTVALTADSLSTSKKNTAFPNNNTTLINNTPFKVGSVYEVRRYGRKGGIKTYVAFPVLRPKINDSVKSSVFQAMTIYANRSNTDTAMRAKHDSVVNQIKNTMGLDITSESGIQKYLKHFITVFNTEKAKTNSDVEAQAKAALPEGTPYIAFIAGGNIVFGQAGIPAYVNQGKKVFSFFINPNAPQTVGLSLNALMRPIIVREVVNGQERRTTYPDRLGWYEYNLNLDNLNENKPIVAIDNNLSATIASTSYRDFLLSNLQTNVRSYNIGTEEKPNWVTNVQPVITYASKETLQQQPKTNEEVKQEILPVNENGSNQTRISIQEGEGLSEIEKQIIEQAKKDLGSDFGISKDDPELLNPITLSDEQKEEVTQEINRIAGLTPDQQFDITDFMYNQITAMVNLETKQVTKADVDTQVEATFKEVIEPLRADLVAKVTEFEKLVEDKPALKETSIPDIINDYKYRIAKIDDIKKSMKVLKEEAYNRVAKYTGITQNKIYSEVANDENSTEENPDINNEDEPNGKERDFWTDILQENPEGRLSYSMRRFFGQVRKYDKAGNPMTGFLGLPTYTGADVVTRNLMVLLADVPSDFDTMIAKLETVKEAIPWMQEVINKLKGSSEQNKNQFVTVMSNTPIRMKFTMISFNRQTNAWSTKVYNTHLNGIADAVMRKWKANLLDSQLIIANNDGNYEVNKKRAEYLINKFEGWKGVNLKSFDGDKTSLEGIRQEVKTTKPVVFTPGDKNILQFFKTNLVKATDRIKISMKGFNYQVTSIGNNKYKMEFLSEAAITNDEKGKQEVTEWLENFGITLSKKTIDELFREGLTHNYTRNTFNALFYNGENTNGLFGILYNRLKYLMQREDVILDEDGSSPLQDSVVTSLANLESKYNETDVPFGFRDNGKPFFALSVPKFITDRNRDLKSPNSPVREQLANISFSKNSFWLRLLQDEDFRSKFGITHIGANAFKEQGVKLYRDNGISNLADVDHELTKLGMFWDMTQGQVSYNSTDKDGREVTLKNYPGTSIGMRMATMFSPTMSDKHMMTLVTTAVLNLESKDLTDGKAVTDEVIRVIYDQTIKPELQRMSKFYQNGGVTDIMNYDKGAGLFLLMPAINEVEYTKGLKLIDAIKHNPNDFTVAEIEKNDNIMKAINEQIKGYIDSLVTEKLKVWTESGLIVRNNNNEITELKFFDKKYLDKFSGKDLTEKASMAAMDYVVNNLVSNANSFMTMAGDPALYYKSNAEDSFTQVRDTFVNTGKRLANQIAPGTSLSNSENEKYIQLFIEDRKSLPEIPFLKFVTKINDGHEITDAEIEVLKGNDTMAKQLLAVKYPIASGYFSIEGSDAQEYTTWKEHLDILSKLGKTPDAISDITPEEISEARDLFSSNTNTKLTEKQMQLISKVMQPIKPVVTGQIHDEKQDVMRTIYIKSSSFPLIPQLTVGFEIDKLRVAMEKIESTHKMNVRASYQSANKVGALKTAVKIWNSEGRMDEEALKALSTAQLVLDRKNFRIQQEVPFKSNKIGEDKISLGTQLMKLLFGDEMMKYEYFTLNGKTYNGRELHELYNNTFIDLVKEKRRQLFTELGLDEEGNATDLKKSMKKLQSILKDEAIKRGYPLQDINGLSLDANGEFNLPLWASSNSNRYESMLNSIVSNRLVRMKFPGTSSVAGSEEGFKVAEPQEGFKGVDKSRIIFTSAWNGSELQASYHAGGEVKKAQVFMSSKFKGPDGKLIDLFSKRDGDYIYITKVEGGGFKLNETMFDKELLTSMTFRIPTSGHQSAAQIEIAGFLPYENADLIIVPRNFTKQKGLDFDVDKENSYHLWTHMNEDGSLEVLQEKHRNKILADADKLLKKELNDSASGKLIASIFGDDVNYTKEDIEGDKGLEKLNSKITEKLMQNELIKINHSVFSNPNNEIQAKINKTLNTNYAEEQAEFIDGLVSTNRNDAYWTPLSDEYQKQKLLMGTSGKIGTGAYSLDVVFHSLVQQAAMGNKGLSLTEIVEDEDTVSVIDKKFRFGGIESDGKLGRAMTLDGGRSIAEVMSERQNIAVDNEKVQVMGRVNLNDITMDVDKVMNLLGFDKGGDGNSISFLFLSQPIIKEFVKRMKNANSNVAEFDANKEETIIAELVAENTSGTIVEDTEEYREIMARQMTNENFIEALKAEKPDGALQIAILKRFIEMRRYGLALRNIQTSINTDSKGLGKSFFDVIEKRNALNRLGESNSLVSGASNLIGEYEPKLGGQSDAEMKEKGFVDIGAYWVKPTTLSGGFSVHGITTAYNLWNRHFPYNSAMVEKVFNEIIPIISSGNVSDARLIDYKQRIFQGIKKYSSASNKTGIISPNDNINDERRRLFIDSETNTSLAKYLKELLNTTGNVTVDRYIKRNNLINRFEFDIQKNGQPSLIKFNNVAGEEFDEQYLYESLATLIEKRGKDGSLKLPKIGNKEYTLDTLAQDLIAYSYIGNATQEAIQFTKYVPMSYLNAVGYSNLMKQASTWFKTNPNILRIRNTQDEVKPEDSHLVSEFTMQYIQHNPERVSYKLDNKSFSKRTIKIDNNSFKLVGEDKPIFISVYDSLIPKGEKKFRLYWFDGEKYSRIPVLGTFGMDEYQPGLDSGTSLINGRVKSTANPQSGINTNSANGSDTGLFNVQSKDLKTIVASIGVANTTKFTELSKALAPYVSSDIKFTVIDGTDFMGRYNRNTRTITISSSILGDAEKLAGTILHELTHDLTVNAISPHITVGANDEVSVNSDAPSYVINLVRLFNNLKATVDADKVANVKMRLKNNLPLGEQLKSNYYGYVNIYEFMSMALTDNGFQEILNQIPYKDTGKTFLERFKEVVQTILESIGMKFNENFTAAQAISNIFEVIDKSNIKSAQNPYQQMYDETMNGNEDTSFLDRLDNELGTDGEPEFELSPTTNEALLEQARVAMVKALPEHLLPHYLANVEGGLKEIAMQVNVSGSENQLMAELYGKDLINIATTLYPNENYTTKNVRDYINTLNSEETKC